MSKTVSGISDLPLDNWRDYDDILVNSLWVINSRDKSGEHDGHYHGNFIPQIPNQFIRRYTAAGDCILDGFLGSGTSLIEAKRLGRSGIGIELLPEVAKVSEEAINRETAAKGFGFSKVVVGDSCDKSIYDTISNTLREQNRESVEFLIFHPPYHDIIRFSENEKDMSNTKSVDEFVKDFGKVIMNYEPFLKVKYYMAIVIGDKYANSELVPLGSMLMEETKRTAPNMRLKSVIVKNMANSRAVGKNTNLWRYRALAGGFYQFGHEYIYLFQKVK